jgi:2-oxoglutarate dehydrogenase E2 component (dihydrolipoamide succinyltransferase)
MTQATSQTGTQDQPDAPQAAVGDVDLESPRSLRTRPPVAPAAANPARGRRERLSRLRKTIGQRMVESLRRSPQLTTVFEADITELARQRDQVKRQFQERAGVKLSYFPLIAKVTLDVLRDHPKLNAEIDDEKGEVIYYEDRHLAVAVDTDRGLLVPVIRDAGGLGVAELARRIGEVADRSRSSKITPDELSGGTFTITNTGSRGALFDTPIINQPQVAILGIGAVVERPAVIPDPEATAAGHGKRTEIRSMVYLALSYDHRLIDGADASRFLSDLKTRLEAADLGEDLGAALESRP